MWRLMILVSLVACSAHVSEEEARRRPDAAVNGDPSRPGVISCFTSANPGQTCTAPTPTCCFAHTVAENGVCQAFADACSYGKESCDGAEDCPLGWKCYANQTVPTAWSINCRLSPPTSGVIYTMCHPQEIGVVQCLAGQTCMHVRDAGVLDLPSALYICH